MAMTFRTNWSTSLPRHGGQCLLRAALPRPAMPRLEERQIRLAVIRDEDERRSRLRMLFPYSIEKPGISVVPSIMRVWSNPFGPLGTPLVDAEGAAETLDNFWTPSAARGQAAGIIVFPDLRLEGRFSQLARAVAIGRDLPLTVTNTYERPMLESLEDGESYLRGAINKKPSARNAQTVPPALGARLRDLQCRPPAGRNPRAHGGISGLEASGLEGVASAPPWSTTACAPPSPVRRSPTSPRPIRFAFHTLDLDGRAIASMVFSSWRAKPIPGRPPSTKLCPLLARQAASWRI